MKSTSGDYIPSGCKGSSRRNRRSCTSRPVLIGFTMTLKQLVKIVKNMDFILTAIPDLNNSKIRKSVKRPKLTKDNLKSKSDSVKRSTNTKDNIKNKSETSLKATQTGMQNRTRGRLLKKHTLYETVPKIIDQLRTKRTRMTHV